MRNFVAAMLLLFAAAMSSASTLDELEARADRAKTCSNPGNQAELAAINHEVTHLVEADGLHTATEFARAARLVTNPFFKLEAAQLRHELAMTAIALGDLDCADMLAATWDEVILATGRPRPFGIFKIEFQTDPGERFEVDETPKCIGNVLLAPVQARIQIRNKKDNPEVARLVEADQAARARPYAPSTLEEGIKLWREDRARFKKIVDLVNGGAVHTAADFEHAALVCQHGSVFGDYQLAHELALCAVVLGADDAMWLAGATYDRMLRSASYPQRFATQFLNGTLEAVSSDGINDTMRRAVVHSTLEDARKQEESLREQMQGH